MTKKKAPESASEGSDMDEVLVVSETTLELSEPYRELVEWALGQEQFGFTDFDSFINFAVRAAAAKNGRFRLYLDYYLREHVEMQRALRVR